MKKKTLVILAGLLALVLLLGIFGLPLFSRLYYGRSQAATLLAWQLRKDRYTTEAAFGSYLAEKRAENAAPYALPEDAEFTVSVSEDAAAGMQCFVLSGADEPQTVVFYFPGGSYIDQPRGVHWTFLNRLAEDTGARVVVPIYPKLPDNDAETAYAALTAFYAAYTADCEAGKTVFMGDSAGGGMALSFAMQLRGSGLPEPEKLVLICPWVDVTMENPEIPAYEKKDPALDSAMLAHLGALWAGDLDLTDPVVSPLYGSFEGLGDITLVTSTGELLYPDARRLDEALADAGIGHYTVCPEGMFHVWPLYIGLGVPEAEETYAILAEVVRGG